jgi:hypothetical protein
MFNHERSKTSAPARYSEKQESKTKAAASESAVMGLGSNNRFDQ